MKKMSFTVKEALEFSERNAIDEWIYSFLMTDGDNHILGTELNQLKPHLTGPILIPVDKLERCMGPEPYMEYVDSVDNWEKHIVWFQELISNGWDMPPLIVHHIDGKLSVRDGNHGLEAMTREGFKEFWVIVWDEFEVFDYSKFDHSDNCNV